MVSVKELYHLIESRREQITCEYKNEIKFMHDEFTNRLERIL